MQESYSFITGKAANLSKRNQYEKTQTVELGTPQSKGFEKLTVGHF